MRVLKVPVKPCVCRYARQSTECIQWMVNRATAALPKKEFSQLVNRTAAALPMKDFSQLVNRAAAARPV